MRNHVHLIGTPKDEKSFGKALNTLTMRYSQYINRKRGLYGHVWQGRYFSCVLDESHLYRAIRYVEKNPVRAKMVKNAEDYKWSSTRAHLGMEPDPVVELKEILEMDPGEWKQYLKEDDVEMAGEIRLKTKKGLVVGAEAFIEKLEKKLNRSLKRTSRGKPKKKVQKGS